MARLNSERHIRVLRWLEAGPATVREIAEGIGISRESARKVVEKYMADGSVRIESEKEGHGYAGNGKATTFRLLDDTIADRLEAENAAAAGAPPELPIVHEPLPVRRIAPPGLVEAAINNRSALERAWSMM